MMGAPCQICEKPARQWADEKNQAWILGVEQSVCSIDCYKLWIASRSLWMTVRLLKHFHTWPFEKFVEVLDFDVAGGYAQEKFKKMQISPFLFLCGLSKDKIIRLAKAGMGDM